MRFILGIILALAMTTASMAIELGPLYNGFCQLNTVYEKTTRDQYGRAKTERVSAGTYSGHFVAENEGAYLILTCGHGPAPAPFGSQTFVKCFHDQNKTSSWMLGKTVWYKWVEKDYTNDLGLIVLLKSEFDRVKYPRPQLVRISTERVGTGHWVYNLGRGGDYKHPTVIRGWVNKVGDHRFWTRPTGQGGRSGSMFFNESGHIVGMLLASDDDFTTVINAPRIMELLHEYQQWANKPRDNSSVRREWADWEKPYLAIRQRPLVFPK